MNVMLHWIASSLNLSFLSKMESMEMLAFIMREIGKENK
jgi:hypothetical protein